jgi:hypothetical protein
MGWVAGLKGSNMEKKGKMAARAPHHLKDVVESQRLPKTAS